MSLEQASFVAQIVSALAVIASLIFVGFQLKKASSAIRANSSQAHSGLYTDLVRSIIDNPEFARAWSIGINDPAALKEGEWVQLCERIVPPLRIITSAVAQRKAGRRTLAYGRTAGDGFRTPARLAPRMGAARPLVLARIP